MKSRSPSFPGGDRREAMELAQTAKARFETTELAAEKFCLDGGRLEKLADFFLAEVHRSSQQEQVFWVLEIAQAMITAVMAVNGDPLPVSEQVDPASFALSVLRDLATDAARKGLVYDQLEEVAASLLRRAEAEGHSNLETYWALNRATAQLELAWARDLAGNDE